MKTVKVIFKNPKFNYITSINPNVSDKDIRSYFINSSFNVGCYPIENLQVCINIEIKGD